MLLNTGGKIKCGNLLATGFTVQRLAFSAINQNYLRISKSALDKLFTPSRKT